MSGSNNNSDERFWCALTALRDVIETDTGGDVDISFEMLRRALLTSGIRASIQPSVRKGMVGASARRLFGGSREVDALIDWLAGTGHFDQKQILRIRRVKLFAETSDGEIVIRPQPIKESIATSWVSLLSMFIGGFVVWAWFGAEGTPNLIANSFALGTIFGALAGKVLDYSFRFAAIRDQVLEVAPWLADGICLKIRST